MTLAPPLAEKQHITMTPDVCGGKPCIAGSRISVQDIAMRTAAGQSPEDIFEAFPHIAPAAIYAALAYYHDHREFIDRRIAEGDAFVEQLKASIAAGTFPNPRV